MTKTNNEEKKPLQNTLDLSDYEERKRFIKENESSMYGGKNTDGEDVLVFLEKCEGMTVRTFQDNGWTRVNFYDSEGYNDGETFEGRWDVK